MKIIAAILNYGGGGIELCTAHKYNGAEFVQPLGAVAILDMQHLPGGQLMMLLATHACYPRLQHDAAQAVFQQAITHPQFALTFGQQYRFAGVGTGRNLTRYTSNNHGVSFRAEPQGGDLFTVVVDDEIHYVRMNFSHGTACLQHLHGTEWKMVAMDQALMHGLGEQLKCGTRIFGSRPMVHREAMVTLFTTYDSSRGLCVSFQMQGKVLHALLLCTFRTERTVVIGQGNGSAHGTVVMAREENRGETPVIKLSEHPIDTIMAQLDRAMQQPAMAA